LLQVDEIAIVRSRDRFTGQSVLISMFARRAPGARGAPATRVSQLLHSAGIAANCRDGAGRGPRSKEAEMSRGVFTALILGALIVSAVPARADDDGPGAAPAPPEPAGPAAADSLAATVPLPDTTLAGELRQARGEFAAELQRLTAERRAAATPAAAREIEGRIAVLKVNDELRALEIHARHARAAGLTAKAAELEQLVAGVRAELSAAATPAAGN
jgi:hypothetical protein